MMRLAPLVVLALALPSQVAAADLSVSYLVDQKTLRKVDAADLLTFELHGDPACASLIHRQTVAAGAVDAMESLRPVGPKRPQHARLIQRLTDLLTRVAVPHLYLRVTGAAILPVGGDCQPQPGALEASETCAPDAVRVGPICVDRYEASVWQVPTSDAAVLAKIRGGTVTLADLSAAGATQVGCTRDPYGHADFPANFDPHGNWTPVPGSDPPSPGVYAVSIPGVLPTACISQFRALQACSLSGKRLIRNDEWQTAASGTPDPGLDDDGATTCSTNFTGLALTGARSACVSNWGVHDMVGNVWEWTADWVDQADVGCVNWEYAAGFGGNDAACFGGTASSPYTTTPGVIIRGGHWYDSTWAGVFAIQSDYQPSDAGDVGVRCVR